MVKVIGNPIGWGLAALVGGTRLAGDATAHIGSHERIAPKVNRVSTADIRRALRLGWDDFAAMRSDALFLAVIYPVIGGVLVAMAWNAAFVHLVFPLLTGFALLGPIAGIGLYAMSKRREAGEKAGIGDAFGAVTRETLPPVLALGAFLFILFAIWLYIADAIHGVTMGAGSPGSLLPFLAMVLTTPGGWAMIVLGTLSGFVLAAIVLVTSLVSFPMLVDRPVGLPAAVVTSLKVARKNPAVVALWGLVIAASLGLGALPALIGLCIAIPVLGHASWHFYRAAVSWG